MRRDAERLEDILDAIRRIHEYASRGRAAFDGDPLIQTWVVHHIEIIGARAGRIARRLRVRCIRSCAPFSLGSHSASPG